MYKYLRSSEHDYALIKKAGHPLQQITVLPAMHVRLHVPRKMICLHILPLGPLVMSKVDLTHLTVV